LLRELGLPVVRCAHETNVDPSSTDEAIGIGGAVATLLALSNKNEVASADACLEVLERECAELFNRWCERRALTPLCYLLHAWPLTYRSRQQMARLYCTLRELEKSEANDLPGRERSKLTQLIRTMEPLVADDRY